MIGISVTSHIVVKSTRFETHNPSWIVLSSNYVEILFMKCDTTIVQNLIMCM
jgi:hypothetical protein